MKRKTVPIVSMSNRSQFTLSEEHLALAKRLAHEAGHTSIDDYLATLIDEQQARLDWKAFDDGQQQAVRAKIDEGWTQARQGKLVDPDEVRPSSKMRE